MSDWITEYAEREWYTAAFLSAKDLEACLRDFDTKRLSMTHEPHITPSRHDLDRLNAEAALARALELLAEREVEVAELRSALVARLDERLKLAELEREVERLKRELVTAHCAIISDVDQQRNLAEARRLVAEVLAKAEPWENLTVYPVRLTPEWIKAAKAAGGGNA